MNDEVGENVKVSDAATAEQAGRSRELRTCTTPKVTGVDLIVDEAIVYAGGCRWWAQFRR